jgi:1-deoxy-D-xylulose-5-phosphate synthase
MHAVGIIDPETGEQVNRSRGRSWTKVFADEIVQLGAERDDVVAITAAMLDPVGLSDFGARFPARTFDVGIAEQHALTSAAGMAAAGLHPFVAVYATFLNRAFDQLLMDVALHKAGVTVVLDRAGVTGDDGPSHNGTWDLAMLGIIPGIHVGAPRDEPSLRAALRHAASISDAPSVVRYPKTPLGDDVPAVRSEGCVDVLLEPSAGDVDVLLISIGAVAADALAAARRIGEAGYSVRVIDPVWVTPVPAALVSLARQAAVVVTVEDGVVVNGAGSRITQRLRDAGLLTPTRELGVPVKFLDHGKVADVRAQIGLTPQGIARRVVEFTAHVLGRADEGSEVVTGATKWSSEVDPRRD